MRGGGRREQRGVGVGGTGRQTGSRDASAWAPRGDREGQHHHPAPRPHPHGCLVCSGAMRGGGAGGEAQPHPSVRILDPAIT